MQKSKKLCKNLKIYIKRRDNMTGTRFTYNC